MRYGYKELFEAIRVANDLLAETNKNEKLRLLTNYNCCSIVSVNIDTNEETMIIGNILRDEAYRWLEGFNTAKMNEEFSNSAPTMITTVMSKFKKFLKI